MNHDESRNISIAILLFIYLFSNFILLENILPIDFSKGFEGENTNYFRFIFKKSFMLVKHLGVNFGNDANEMIFYFKCTFERFDTLGLTLVDTCNLYVWFGKTWIN